MFKVGKFINMDNETLNALSDKLDKLNELTTNVEKQKVTLQFNDTITDLVNKSFTVISKPQLSVMDIINDFNPNIRMPTNAINMLLDYICSYLVDYINISDIVTSASEPIICSNGVFIIIKDCIISWLEKNKAHYVIL
jgi:hypothetical protein